MQEFAAASGPASATGGTLPPPAHIVLHTYGARVISSCQQNNVPESPLALSLIFRVHVPFAAELLRAESGVSGLNDPANGAVPALMAVAAASSKTVKVPVQSVAPLPKLSPELPRRLDKATGVPFGATTVMARSPSKVWLSRTLTLTSTTAPMSGTTIV